MGEFFSKLGSNIESHILAFFNAIPAVLAAILWLIIAFVIATVVKNLVIKMLKALKVDQYLTKWGVTTETKNSAIDFVGKLVYFVVFLLFLPVALGKLGLSSVASPIVSVVDSFLRIVPNLVAASVVLVVGLFIAKLVKDLLIPILRALKIDTLQQKAGVQANESTSFSVVLANIVYAVIVLVVISAALSMLGISAIYAPANQIVTAIFKAIPLIICAILIIAIGVFIAKLVAKLLESLLASIGTDKLAEKITGIPAKVSLSKTIAAVVKYVIVVIVIVQAVNVLNLPVLTQIGTAIIDYLPAVLSVVIVVAIAVFCANTAENLILKKFPKAKGAALIAKVAIYVLAAFISLSQLNIAQEMVNTTFILIIAALCIAFAIAFGVGGRFFAQNFLKKLEDKLNTIEEKKED